MKSIRKLDSFDVVGVRLDGEIDLVISCYGPLDDSTETLAALEKKIRSYVSEVQNAKSPTFFERYNCKPDAKVTIYVSCQYEIHAKVLQLIDQMQLIAAQIGSRIKVQKQMG